jgi:hypothetical protein
MIAGKMVIGEENRNRELHVHGQYRHSMPVIDTLQSSMPKIHSGNRISIMK